MRFFGFLFILILILAGVGFFRGWFSITTTQAGGRSDVTVGIDRDKMGEDANAAKEQLGKLSARAEAAIKAAGKETGTDARVLEGTVTAFDLPARKVTVNVGTDVIELFVDDGVLITRNGANVGFEGLGPATRARFTFQMNGGNRLTHIEILS